MAMTLPSLEGDSNRLRGTGSPAVIELRPWELSSESLKRSSVNQAPIPVARRKLAESR